MQSRLAANLVKLAGDNVQDCAASDLNQVRFYVIYQSAHWCGPCRQFTPKLVEFYRRMKPAHPEFEVIFASCDHDEASMISYMRGEKMPWPTLRDNNRQLLNQYCGSGIPWLVVVDPTGRPLTKTESTNNTALQRRSWLNSRRNFSVDSSPEAGHQKTIASRGNGRRQFVARRGQRLGKISD